MTLTLSTEQNRRPAATGLRGTVRSKSGLVAATHHGDGTHGHDHTADECDGEQIVGPSLDGFAVEAARLAGATFALVPLTASFATAAPFGTASSDAGCAPSTGTVTAAEATTGSAAGFTAAAAELPCAFVVGAAGGLPGGQSGCWTPPALPTS